jgi:hypothetical protein
VCTASNAAWTSTIAPASTTSCRYTRNACADVNDRSRRVT